MSIFKNLFSKIINHLNGQAKNITSAAFIISVASLLSGILGLLRDRLLAARFGAGDDLDVYYAAFRLPDLIYALLIFGALSGGVIPVFTGYLKKNKDDDYEGDKETWDFANNLLNIFLLGLLFVCAILYIFAPGLVVLLTPGFSPDKMALTTKLTRIFLMATFILSASGFFSSFLQSFKRFFVFAWAGVVYNLGIILGIIFLVPRFGVSGVAMGVVLGTIFHLSIQLPPLIADGYRWRPIFNIFDRGIFKVFTLMIPRSVSLGISQLNYVAITMIASGLASGSLAIFNFSYNLVSLPIGIFGASFATASFPVLCDAFHERNWQKFKEGFSSSFRQIVFLTLPTAIFLLVFREYIVRIILNTGRFNLAAANLTIEALGYFAVTLVFDSLVLLLIRTFLAMENSLLPALIIFAGSVVRIGSALVLSRLIGVSGLALGFSIGGLANVLLLWFFLKGQTGRYFDNLNEKQIISSAIKVLSIALLAGLVARRVLWVTVPLSGAFGFWGLLMQSTLAGLIGIAVYVVLGLFLKLPEIKIIWNSLARRLPLKETISAQLELIEEKKL